MKHIVSIVFTQNFSNFDRVVNFFGEKIRISQYSIPFDTNEPEKMIQEFDGKCDVMAISGLPHSVSYRNKIYNHEKCIQLQSVAKETLVVDGQKFRNVYIPWVLRNYCQENKHFIKNQKIGVLVGLVHKNIISILEEYNAKIYMADPYLLFNIPLVLKDTRELDLFFNTTKKLLKKYPMEKDIKRHFSAPYISKMGNLQKFSQCGIIITYRTFLDFINLDFLKDKAVVIDHLDKETEKLLKSVGVRNVVSCMPDIIDIEYMNFAVLEAIFQSFHKEHTLISSDDILDWIDRLKLSPDIKMLNERTTIKKTKFAFVIHPLTDFDLFRHPLLSPFRPFSKQMLPLIKAMTKNVIKQAKIGTITGIQSESTGERVEGDIYTLFETPREMMISSPEKIYKKLVQISKMAQSSGAEIMGLGAYTKIVGDQGITVARKSLIPITTGNSLSAAATLWAAGHAIKKMGLVYKKEEGPYQGFAMIVGATGSIGAVSSKLLAQHWQKLILVAPRGHKLLELRDQILEISPNTEIKLATNSNKYLHLADLVITSTSGQGESILDIMNVKPGAVICDVSRPFDIPESDALKRADVLIIASGEVELPGKVKSQIDMGLHGTTVYACLAETALLALEGRLESFTLSRNISYKKVKEIDQMARKHGVRLAQIMGHSGIISDSEIELCRYHALKKKSELSQASSGEDKVTAKTFRS